ncbi:complex I subunit 5 family protein [Xanthobacter autotrophicus DSM 431]|uniref:complex I subunit 5 family protein n=1 Tax=Xanthobacter nonsaccharivorans TaxID=3119912 RepID=UPI003726F7A3
MNWQEQALTPFRILRFAGELVGYPDVLLLASVAVPLVLGLLAVLPGVRRHSPDLAILAPLPALIAALLVPRGTAVLAAPDPLRFTLSLDTSGALLLGGAAVLWLTASLYAAAYLRKDPARGAFGAWWLLTMAGSFAVFLVADVASFYLAYALVSFSAFGLAAHDDTPEARRAGNIYLALTVLGEAFLIAGFVMLASGAPEANPLIRDAVAALPASPWKGVIVLLLLLGFALKMGLFPLHFWMPLAHAVAPVPGSAALSGIVVKAGVIGLIRFLPQGVPLPDWGGVLTVAGLFTAYYGIAIGLTQHHPKRALAYSTVSQMGVVAAVLGAGLSAGAAAAFPLAAFYAVNHMLLKGAMFLAVGIAMTRRREAARGILAVAALLGLSLAGLPFTGGALAKYAVKDVAGSGTAGLLLTLSAAGTTLLMARYVLLLARAAGGKEAPRGLLGPWAWLSFAALAAPFALFAPVTGTPLSSAFAADALLKGAWPVALGLGAAVLLFRVAPRVPEVPAGDIVVLAGPCGRLTAKAIAAVVVADGWLRRWPVAGAGVVMLAVWLFLSMEGAGWPLGR